MSPASNGGSVLSVLNGDDLAVIWDDVVGAISLALNDYDTETLEAVAQHAEEINAEGWLAKVIREYLMVWRGL